MSGQKKVTKPEDKEKQTTGSGEPKKVETEEMQKKAQDFLEKLDDRLPKKEEQQKILKRKQQSGE